MSVDVKPESLISQNYPSSGETCWTIKESRISAPVPPPPRFPHYDALARASPPSLCRPLCSSFLKGGPRELLAAYHRGAP